MNQDCHCEAHAYVTISGLYMVYTYIHLRDDRDKVPLKHVEFDATVKLLIPVSSTIANSTFLYWH